MNAEILVVNAGSSSLKFGLYRTVAAALEMRLRGQVEGIGGAQPRLKVSDARGAVLDEREVKPEGGADHGGAVVSVRAWLEPYLAEASLAAVGHRVVHGGSRFSGPVLVDAAVLAQLEALIPLAPLHQPQNLAAIRAVRQASPDLPQVACFDTAFHRSQPAVARRLALPRDLDHEVLRRYGFHGLSYEYLSTVLPTLDPVSAAGRVIVAHLGNGASLCAMRGGRSVATTMGFSVLDGLVMGTRCGALDPGVLLYLMDQHGMDARALEDLLYKRSGLLGVSGTSSDMRELLAGDDAHAAEAVELFVYRIGREIGSLAAALGGLDALVFTGGIGENAAEIRARVCRDAAWLGIELDEEANRAATGRISVATTTPSAWVVPTDENLMIARHTWQVALRDDS